MLYILLALTIAGWLLTFACLAFRQPRSVIAVAFLMTTVSHYLTALAL